LTARTGPEAYHQTVAVEIEHHLIVCFCREAQRRDVPVTRLIRDLLDVIAADGADGRDLGRPRRL
jgi:hypothetical protein